MSIYASRQGSCGRRPAVEAYPFQDLDISTKGEFYTSWEAALGLEPLPTQLAHLRSLDVKYAGQFTPFGTPVADVARRDQFGLLATKCGNCGIGLTRCLCDFRADAA